MQKLKRWAEFHLQDGNRAIVSAIIGVALLTYSLSAVGQSMNIEDYALFHTKGKVERWLMDKSSVEENEGRMSFERRIRITSTTFSVFFAN